MNKQSNNHDQKPVIRSSEPAVPGHSVSPELNTFTNARLLKLYGANQQKYVQNILKNDLNFGVGPAGTGKTFLAVACAVSAFQQHKVHRILLVRPVVEAGEQLGFLPGDFTQKVNPYLRPLYDALYELLGFEKVEKYLQQQIIEIAPLAYMRGRTLNDAFIILDEGQNTTIDQMKMFLTRLGFSSKIVVTGDPSQVDLPKGKLSGLRHAVELLKNVNNVGVTYFESKDVMRHPLVKDIIEAYAAGTDQKDDSGSRTTNSN